MANAKVNVPDHVFTPPQDLAGQAQTLVNETVSWLRANSLHIAIALAVGVVIVALLLAVQKFLQRLAREETLVGWRTIVSRIASKTSFWFLVIVAARLVDGYADAPPLLDKTIGFLFTVGLTFQAAVWARELALGFIEHRAGIGEADHVSALGSAMGIIRFLVTFTLFAIALVLVLGNLGVNVAGLVAGLGIGGIAIGLAAQGIFADLFAGLSILFDRPFRVGDNISFGSSSGTVVAIGMKSTRIRAYTGELRVISNKKLTDNEILNVSGRDHIRIAFTLSVTYETKPDTLARIPAILRELGEAEGVKVARASFDDFGASSLDFAFQFDTPGNDWPATHAVRDRIMVRIMERFAAEGIGLAYPTQTTYTAAPDGTLIMPYAEGRAA